MKEAIFWGEKGEYGPFSVQEDGWPNAGEVIRHFRRKLSMSAEELAKRYGEAIGEPITSRWILKMEQQNKVPMDISRRRAFYRRGYTGLEWSIFGDKVQLGTMNVNADRKRLETAIADFEQALPIARPQLKGAIWLELSRARGLLQDTVMTVNLSSRAGEMVGVGSSVTDPLEQILLEGALNGLNEGMYLLGKAAALIVLGRTTSAIELLDELDELKNGQGIARNQARRLAYADTLRAEASLGTKDYFTSTTRAISALETFRDIHNIERIAWINSIYKRLVERHGHHPEVKTLGKMLANYYQAL